MIPHDRPALTEIEITPAMIEAGAEIVDGQFGDFTTFERGRAQAVAREVFEVMLQVYREKSEDTPSRI